MTYGIPELVEYKVGQKILILTIILSKKYTTHQFIFTQNIHRNQTYIVQVPNFTMHQFFS